jgi:hypothetical protein
VCLLFGNSLHIGNTRCAWKVHLQTEGLLSGLAMPLSLTLMPLSLLGSRLFCSIQLGIKYGTCRAGVALSMEIGRNEGF